MDFDTRLLPVRKGVLSFVSSVIDLIYPTICAGCDCVMTKSAVPLCLSCFASLEEVGEGRTQQFLDSITEMPMIDHATALWYYDPGSPVRTLHRSLKYGGMYDLGVELGKRLGVRLAKSLIDCPAPEVIIPVPVHRIRLLERGFNQAETIASGVASVLNLPLDTRTLMRTRLSGSQTALDRASRSLNLAGAFALRAPSRIRGRHVLLVDDVITTGATIAATVQTIQSAEPAGCSIAALALVRPVGELKDNLRHRPDRHSQPPLPDHSSR